MKATLLQMRMVESPPTLSADGRRRALHLRPWRDGWRHLRFMLLYSPRWLFLYPGLAMMGVGVLLTVALLFGRIWIGPVSLDVHTMLYASALILIGFQSAMFSLYSKIFAIAEGLLPADTRVSWLHRHFTLETGLVAGSILFLLGTLGSVLAVVYWGRHSFGEINPEALLRLVVPSVLAMTLGVQIVLSGFFLSLLMMRRRA